MSEKRSILLLAHLAAEAGRTKLCYLESLDSFLRVRGYKLLLVEQQGHEIDTTCDVARIPDTLPLSDDLRTLWKSTPGLQHAVDVDAGHFAIDAEASAVGCLPLAEWVRSLLKSQNVSLCILWHQFNGVSMAIEEFCRQDGIPHVFAHLGPLPGTIIFEQGGQMAESWVSTESEGFRALPITDYDRIRAGEYLEFARSTFADRKPQTREFSIEGKVQERRKTDSALLFYAGQNDYRTGMLPPDLPKAKLHSPYYDSTIDALNEIERYADEQGYGVLFKPHPNVLSIDSEFETSTIELVHGANIFECILHTDVTVTVLSSASYLALIHNRPVVLLGRSPLNDKGCAYEVPSRDRLGETLDNAIQKGLTEAQRDHWITHVAQLLRYYLFEYDNELPYESIRGPQVAADFLIDCAHGKRAGFCLNP